MSQEAKAIVEGVRPYVTPLDEHPPVIDFERSKGARLYDLGSDAHKIDFASSYAAVPLGYNHPGFHDAQFEKDMIEVSRTRIANLDILSAHYKGFLDTFRRVVGPKGFDRFFFIDGGALAVENALKAAFDWKVRQNQRKGKEERGYEILHFRQAFHGRTGYTLSLTNTRDPNKIKNFPKFPWPRVSNPKCEFPLEGDALQRTQEREEQSKKEIMAVLQEKADDVAAILIEPMQGEGGDNHFRPEFLQFLRSVCDEFGCLLIYDEVQTGMCASGKPWMFQALGVEPDMVCFAKKAQVGGFMAGPRLMEEPENVFKVPSRISSTWGSSLTDMVRCRKVLEIVEQEGLMQNAHDRGEEILEHLRRVERETELIANVRGRGLLIAFDLVKVDTRAKLIQDLYKNGLIVLMCGEKSVRFRPHLNVTSEVIGEALEILEKTLESVDVFASRSD